MIDKALDWLEHRIKRSVEPIPVLEGDPAAETFLFPDGEVRKIPRPNKPINAFVSSLGDLIASAKEHSEKTDEAEDLCFWYAPDGVTLVIDHDQGRYNRIRFPLHFSDTFQVVRVLPNGPWMDQKQFIRLLRISLARSGVGVEQLLSLVRKVRFENGMIVTGDRTHTGESLGRDIISKVETPAGKLPETVTIEVAVYKNPGERELRVPITCAVEIEPAQHEAFRLTPLPDEIDRAVEAAQASIRDRLTKAFATQEGVLVYAGTPG